MKNKTAVEKFIEKLKEEHGNSIFRNCDYEQALSHEKQQLHSAYMNGVIENQNTKIKTVSQYALDYIYETYKI